MNIALVRDGAAVFGVVFAPVHGHMYRGEPALGASREADGRMEPLRYGKPEVFNPSFVASRCPGRPAGRPRLGRYRRWAKRSTMAAVTSSEAQA